MDEYFCPNCGAILNDQSGFNPDNPYWTCTECGMQLFGDGANSGERFPETIWYCDSCGANLSRQPGFSDYNDTWCCTECGHENHISGDKIYESEADYQAAKNSDDYSSDSSSDEDDDEYGYGEEWQYENPRRCECCDRLLNKQDGYEDDLDSFECTGCGYYNSWSRDENQNNKNDSFSNSSGNTSNKGARFPDIVWYCDSCGACLSEQSGFSDYNDFWICTECGYETRIEDDGHRPNVQVVDIETEYDDEEDEEDEEDEDVPVKKKKNADKKTKSGKKKAKSNKNKNNKSENRGCLSSIIGFYVFLIKACLWIAGVGLAVLLVGGGIYYGYNYIHGATNTIQIGISSDELLGLKNYEVTNYFKKLGFTNVTERGIADVSGNELDQAGTVTAISIGGQTSFTADTKVPFNKNIEVIYRKIKPVMPPLKYKMVKGKQYDVIREEFERAGFVNIIDDPVYDVQLGWFNSAGEVKEVSIDGNSKYLDDEEYRPDVTVVITYHASKSDKL